MTWSSTCPDGSVTVKANEPILQGNITYIENTMESTALDTSAADTVKDHMWNIDAVMDGRHRFVSMPAYLAGGVAADPALHANLDGIMYVREDDFVDTSPTNEFFFRNSGGIRKLSEPFNIRAGALVTAASTTPVWSSLEYNIKASTGVVKVPLTTGRWAVLFDKVMPDANYMVNIQNQGDSARTMFVPQSTQADTGFDIYCVNSGGTAADTVSFSFQVYR
jgi:hypothetical protein